MYFSVFFIFESPTAPDISMVNISQSLAILLDCFFDNSHCMIVTRVNEHRFASDFGYFLQNDRTV